jgi:serine protease Do
MRLKRLFVVFVTVSMVHFSGALGTLLARQATAPDGKPAPGVSRADALATAPDLAALQRRIRSVVQGALPSVVFMSTGAVGATGVIISPEGLMLTQAHVLGLPILELRRSHGGGPASGYDGLGYTDGKPANSAAGLKYRFRFHDGTPAEAEVVGTDRLFDLALLRVVKPGSYPFTSLAEYDPAPGMGVLKFGYPFEVRELKCPAASVRFGTVLITKPEKFVIDFGLNGGDSGGPYIDLDGRVVGMMGYTETILDVPGQGTHPHNFSNTRVGMWWGGIPATVVRERLARMAKGELLEPTETDLVWYHLVKVEGVFREKHQYFYHDFIPRERWTQGKDVLGRFQIAVADAKRSVVEVLDGDEPTALGTVVDTTGLVLTKASEVPDGVRCRLPGGQVTTAEVVGVDPAYDLALLRVPVAGLVPITWPKSAEPPAGTLVATVGTRELPATVGIVSIARWDSRGPHPSTPYHYQRPKLPASPPEITGRSAPGGRFVVETAEGNAAAAGVRPGDVILAIAGKQVPDNSTLMKPPASLGMNRYDLAYWTFQRVLRLPKGAYDENGRRAGERVPVQLLRGDKPIELTVTLPAPKEGQFGFMEFVVPSRHADISPTVITADIPVLGSECGGPAVGLDGTAIGLVISRFGVTGSYIIPADRVAARLVDLRAGKPLSGFPAPAVKPLAPASGAPRKKTGVSGKIGDPAAAQLWALWIGERFRETPRDRPLVGRSTQ